MASQMLLGSGSSSIVTAQTVAVSALSTSTATASVVFRANGSQATGENGSLSTIGNWVNPAFAANEWEIRATLDSGVTPSVGTLNTWEALTSDRIWSLSRLSVGISECSLTFEFRRAGASDPEVTVALNTLSAERLDIF